MPTPFSFLHNFPVWAFVFHPVYHTSSHSQGFDKAILSSILSSIYHEKNQPGHFEEKLNIEYLLTEAEMRHILKIAGLLAVLLAVWIGLLQSSLISPQDALLLPVYLIIALGCYGLGMVGIGLLVFPTCPKEALLLEKDVAEAKAFLEKSGVDVSSHDS
jgi:dolichyl-phosphate mannosyltransferase polypeptide 3